MNFNQRIPNFKKQHQKSIPPTSTTNVGRKYSVFSSDLKVTDMKRARLSPSRLVHLSSCSAAQHISPPHLVIWSTQPVQMFKPWDTKKIQTMALWQAEGANSETQTLSFCKNTGDLFFTSTQSPSGEHSCPALTSLRFWSRPFDQIFYYALLALRRRCAAKGINF